MNDKKNKKVKFKSRCKGKFNPWIIETSSAWVKQWMYAI